jgi:cytochrome oxidase Cu insertion factor (SCO1/SenC/PrrC family)
MSENASGRHSNLTLWIIFAVCVAPFLGSFVAYLYWKPAGQVNYGELLQVAPLPEALLKLADGRAFSLAELKGRWVLVSVDSGACDEYCRKKLYFMRQVRLTQGKDMQRVERLWLITDGEPVPPDVAQGVEGTWLARAGASGLPGALPAERRPADHIYLLDPLGNVVLRYPRDPDPSRMKKDLTRLLKTSRVG